MTAPAAKALPRKWRGPYTTVLTLSDKERRRLGLSHQGSIREIIGGLGTDVAEVLEAIEYARSRGIATLDTETTGLDPFSDKIILVQIGDDERQYLLWWQTLSQTAKALVKEYWGDPEVKKTGVNLKFDALAFIGNEGMDWRGAGLLDAQIIEQILDCGLTGDIGFTMKVTGMGPMAQRWLGWIMPKDEEIRTGWGEMTPGKWYPTLEECGGDELEYERQKQEGLRKRYYAADDCVVPVRLLDYQLPWVKRLDLTETLKLEMEFLPDLAQMEAMGLLLDWDAWVELAKEADEGLKKAETALDALFDVTVTTRTDLAGNVEVTRDKNYGSKDQLKDLIRQYMWEHYGIEVIGNNGHFRQALERAGMNPARLDKMFQQKMVDNPEKPGTRKKVGYPAMTDYIEGSEFVESLWERFQHKLPAGSFALTTTDSKVLKLTKIVWQAREQGTQIDLGLMTQYGLPPDLIDPILKHREFSTKLERYAYSWRDLIHPVTGRLHTDTTQTAADTGRLTTSPNFQNLPADPRYRKCIIARRGYKIVAADFSQIEPRIIAELSNCELYMKVFWSEKPGTKGFEYWCGDDVTEPLDLYGMVGATMGIMPPEAARKSEAKKPENKKGRGKAKIVVLGLGYGTGKPKFYVAYLLDTGEYHIRHEADNLFDAFWIAVQEVKETLDALSAIADPQKSKRKIWHPFVEQKVTWSETLGGRKRFFGPGSQAWWTQGRNHPIQGAGADILKRTVVELSKWLRAEKIDGFIIVTAHDEILCEIAERDADRVATKMEEIMSKVGQYYCPHVPITAGATITDFWVKD